MVSYLPVECIREILEYLRDDTNSLYSCLLVNRNWCEITVPILWRNPFGRDLKSSRCKMLINTYVSRLKTEEIPDELFTIPNEISTFNYATFLRVFDCEKILLAFHYWAISISSFRLFIFKLLIQHLIANSPKFDRIDFKKSMLFSDNIFLFPGARRSFSKLRNCNFFGEYTKGLIDSCANVARDIRYISFRCLEPQHPNVNSEDVITSDSSMDGLARLIRSQRQLKKILLSDGRYNTMFKNEIFESLTTQSDTLTVIKFLSINFHENFPLRHLLICKNLKVLKIVNCKNYGNCSKIMEKLQQFHQLKAITFNSSRLPFELYRKLISLAGYSLQTVVLMGKVFAEIPLPNSPTNNPQVTSNPSSSSSMLEPFIEMCPNIRQFLACVNESQIVYLPSLLRSCRNLKRISLYDQKYQSRSFYSSIRDMQIINVENLLAEIGRAIPPSLIKFNINMNWKFSVEAFGSFLQNLGNTSTTTTILSKDTRKDMRTTRAIQLQRLSFQFCTCLTDEHIEMFYMYPIKGLNILKIRGAEGISEDGFRKLVDFFGDCVGVPQKFRKQRNANKD